MACPLCGDECRCSYAPGTSPAGEAISFSSDSYRARVPHPAVLVDPEVFEDSEQQFAASLNTQVGSDAQHESPIAVGEGETWTLVSASAAQKLARARAARQAPVTATSGEAWREEVATRLEKYRKRRGRPESSLQFDFETPQPAFRPAKSYREADPHPAPEIHYDAAELLADPAPLMPAAPPTAPFVPTEDARAGLKSQQGFGAEQDHSAESLSAAAEFISEPQPSEAALAPEEDFVFEDDPEPAKVIQFPRAPVTPPSSEELAEPVLDFPRILEAPEAVATATPLADITLNEQADEAIGGLLFDLPLQPASMEQRVFAGLVDALLVMLSGGVFVLIAAQLSANLPGGKLGFALAAALPCVLWALYEYMFLVYAGETPGMRLAHIGVATFEGESVPRNLRKWRAIAMVLSGCSLGLGLLWALLDEDTLCWHDRITKTFPVPSAQQ